MKNLNLLKEHYLKINSKFRLDEKTLIYINYKKFKKDKSNDL